MELPTLETSMTQFFSSNRLESSLCLSWQQQTPLFLSPPPTTILYLAPNNSRLNLIRSR